MSEDTPERLKDFRAQHKPAPARTSKLAIAQLAVLIAGFGVVIALLLRPAAAPPPQSSEGGLTPEKQREYAVRLEEKQQPLAAMAAYEEYMRTASLTPPERAKVCYNIAKLAIDAEKYDAALPYLYQSEFLDPNSDVKDEINKKVVLCLDKLGRTVDLRHELRKRTNVKRTAADVQPGETVLAECAGEVITNRDLENEIEKLPPAARETFNTPEKKVELLKNMVAERLLLDKARRLELDKTPEIQDMLAKQVDAMIVQKLISDEVRAAVNVTPEDAERFYKAEIDRFKEPASAEVRVAKADSEESAKAIKDFPNKPVTVIKGGRVPGTSEDITAPDGLFTAEPDAIVGPVQAEKSWYVFKLVSKKDERTPPYEEVKEQALRALKMQKEQEKVAAIIDETLQARDVHLYPERLKEPAPAK